MRLDARKSDPQNASTNKFARWRGNNKRVHKCLIAGGHNDTRKHCIGGTSTNEHARMYHMIVYTRARALAIVDRPPNCKRGRVSAQTNAAYGTLVRTGASDGQSMTSKCWRSQSNSALELTTFEPNRTGTPKRIPHGPAAEYIVPIQHKNITGQLCTVEHKKTKIKHILWDTRNARGKLWAKRKEKWEEGGVRSDSVVIGYRVFSGG